jgi:hypothetical protein
VKSDQRIEDEQFRLVVRERREERRTIGLEVEAEYRRCDDVQIERVDVESAMLAQSIDSGALVHERILGKVDESGALLVDVEMVEA